MSISTINSSYSKYSASLTSPFLNKKVSINSYTPYSTPKASPGVISRYDMPQAKSFSSSKLQVKSYNPGIISYKESSRGAIKQLINNGYSPAEAVSARKAQIAYGMNAVNNKNGVYKLSNNIYRV